MYVYSACQIPESGGDNNNNAATSNDDDDNRGDRDDRDDLYEDEDDGIVSAPNVLASVDLTKTIGGLRQFHIILIELC